LYRQPDAFLLFDEGDRPTTLATKPLTVAKKLHNLYSGAKPKMDLTNN
jgi:hypothetical protein